MITLEEMLRCGVHLGHNVKLWNPKMSPYIFGQRNSIHIIDIVQTYICLKRASNFLSSLRCSSNRILFVCTKPRFRGLVEQLSTRYSVSYVTQRWLGGTLTNWSTVRKCIFNLQDLINKQGDYKDSNLKKKEYLKLAKRVRKLEKYLGGVRFMTELPKVVVLIGQMRELVAVKECLKLSIPLIVITDTNCDPTLADMIIPANDDSVSSVSLILNELLGSINTNI